MIRTAKNLTRALPWLLASFGALLGAARPLPASDGFATYLGSSGADWGEAVATDSWGNVYIAAIARYDDFLKVTEPQPGPPPYYEYFGYSLVVTALDPEGRLLYSTYTFHTLSDRFIDVGGIAASPDGGAVVVGTYYVDDNYFAFALKVSPSGQWEWLSFLGGLWTRARGVAIDGWSGVYVTGDHFDDGWRNPTRGQAAFVVRLDGNSGAVGPLELLDGDGQDQGRAITVDAAGNVVVTGATDSNDFPGQMPWQSYGGGTDAFVAWFSPEGPLSRSVSLKGSGTDEAFAIVPTSDGAVVVLGSTDSNDFPTLDPQQATLKGPSDLFLTRLDPHGWRASTYLDGEATDLAIGPGDRLFLLGHLSSAGGECQAPAVSTVDAEDFRIVANECIPGVWSDALAVDPAGFAALTGGASRGLLPVNALQSFHAGMGDAFAIRKQLNRPPDCSRPAASPSVVWPPNNLLLPVAVTGVNDPDGDPVALRITAIRQDEPRTGREPDASGLGNSQLWVRAHRDGKGDGRVYHIAFEARDDQGAACTGEVSVCVPHDASENVCKDGGALVDSTQ